jgi:hypothetical protein
MTPEIKMSMLRQLTKIRLKASPLAFIDISPR